VKLQIRNNQRYQVTQTRMLCHSKGSDTTCMRAVVRANLSRAYLSPRIYWLRLTS